jgi:predicted transcriptional regulator
VQVRRGWGDLGHQILDVLLAAEGPLTAAQVHAELDGHLAYSTVTTVLSRLRDKGLLLRRRDGRSFTYSPAHDPGRVTARRMHRILAIDPDRAAALARFVDGLGPDDEAALRHRLDDATRSRAT